SAVFQAGTNQLRLVRPQAGVSKCADVPVSQVAEVPFPGNLTVSGNLLTYSDKQPTLQGVDYVGSGSVPSWSQRTGNGWDAGNLGAAGFGQVSALSGNRLVGARLAGGQTNTLYSATTGTSLSFDWNQNIAQPTGPLINSSGAVWIGRGTQLEQFGTDGGTTAILPAVAGTHLASPVLGEGGRIFAVADTTTVGTQQLHSWSLASPSAPEWSAILEPSASKFEASLTLDCSRDTNGNKLLGRAGVLYAVTRTGTLYSVIVDSKGIDTTAHWPKYQRDPRNSGSADTALQEFDCR
ncbi:MAG: hypothetical protein H6Q89_4822, partial [Myxococcaceae bacterium]|nr:hypothetical protein [Myxococcaceae bacterium]